MPQNAAAARRLVFVLIVLGACDAGGLPPLSIGGAHCGGLLRPECPTDHEPTAREVAAMLSRDYLRPQLVAVTLDRDESAASRELEMRNWEETYDGILVDNDVISVHQSTWITRFRARLHEPDLVDKRRLLTENVARAHGKISPTTSGRLVYVPRLVQLRWQDRTGPESSELVTDGYDLAYEFDTTDEIVRVDVYSGTVERFSHRVD